jgi:hypothetical protein
MPITLMEGGEGPLYGIPGEAVLNMLILEDVRPVVEAGELVVNQRIVEDESGGHQ